MRKFILFLFALLCLGSVMTVKADTYKIYIHDQTGWNNGRALYCWGSGEHLGSWPGTTTYTSENVGGVDFIVFTVNENVIDQNLIFNNNNNGQQINLPTLSARDYYLNVTSSSVTVLGVILKGGFNGWDNSDVFTDNGETATLARNINAGTYEFKITIDGDWRSNNTTIKRADSGTEYDFSGNPSNNAKLEADITGDYTFTWTYATKSLEVTFPSADTKYYLHGSFNEWVDIEMTENAGIMSAAATLEANVNDYRFKIKKVDFLENVTWYGAQDVINMMTKDNCTNWDLDDTGGFDIYITSDTKGDYKFSFNPADKKLNVIYPSGTGINNVEMGEKAVKVIENGQLYIIKNGVKINALGTVVK